MELLGFWSDWFGLAGSFHAMYHPDAGKCEETDFIAHQCYCPKTGKTNTGSCQK